MTERISTLALVSTSLISSHKVLKLLQTEPFHSESFDEKIREVVYLAYKPWAAREPDHVFERSWQFLGRLLASQGRPCWLQSALYALKDEFLEPQHGVLQVKLNHFGTWQQSVLSRVCGLPVRAAAHALTSSSNYLAPLDSPSSSLNPSNWASIHLPILMPYDSLIEDYVRREGLHETHLHLNGSTHAEQCWLRALLDPLTEISGFNVTWNKTGTQEAQRIRELALTINPELNPAELCRQLFAGRRLREWLIAAATDTLGAETKLPFNYEELANDDAKSNYAPAPAFKTLELTKESSSSDELYWLQAILKRLQLQPSIILERMLHCYLLLQNQHYRLLVQSEEQYGFDQFQKFTHTDLRTPAEQDYLNRFYAMHGKNINYSRTGYVEGRFAPKSSTIGNDVILTNILSGYWRYLRRESYADGENPAVASSLSILLEQLEKEVNSWSPNDRRHMRLALVVHFIKQRWNSKNTPTGLYRHYELRTDLENKANALIHTLNNWPRLRNWVRGVDAAANELDAPPEVFASIYRICQQAGLTRRSYHVGEDFPHLLSGLRQMLDALELLNLRDGDRIGHGTAMGIAPTLWLSRIPNELLLSKGDWMLDLLATWRLLRRLGITATAYHVECDLATLASEVFGREISCIALERAMRLRHLNLRFLKEAQDPQWSVNLIPISDLWRNEALLVEEVKLSDQGDLKLLWEWQSDRAIWERSETQIKVKADYLDANLYLKLQQELMREVCRRNVLIETLPSSNVRISQYSAFSEHHSFRWMRVPNFLQDGDPPIMVTLGSDDPGIFAGDLSSEFYQLYATLRGVGLGDKEALNYIASLNERGREYRFHDPVLG